MSVPLLAAHWGTTYYGEWLLLFTIPSYLSLSDAGLISALGNDLSVCIANRDYRSATSQLSSTLATVLGISLVCASGLLIIHGFVPYQQLLGITVMVSPDVRMVLAALTIYTIGSVQQELLSSVYRAERQYAVGRMWISVTRLLEFVVMIFLVSWGSKAPAVAIGLATVRIVALLGMWVDSWCRFRWIRHIAFEQIRWAVIRRLVRPSVSFLVFALANAIVLQGSILVIGALLTPVHVVVYNTLRTLSNASRQLIGILNFSLWPEFTLALSQGRIQAAIALHRLACQTTFWLMLVVIAGLEVMGTLLLQFWTKGAVLPDQPLYSLFLVSSLTYTLWNTSALTAISTNRHQSIGIAYLLSSTSALILGTLLIQFWPLSGLVVSFIIADLAMMYVVFRYSVALLKTEQISTLLHSILFDFRAMKQVGKQLISGRGLIENTNA